jgi:hypothetical protein
MCSTCDGKLEATKFDKENLKKHQDESRKDPLVCLECRETKGVTPKDTRLYNCPVCGDRGHLKFDAEAFGKVSKGARRPEAVALM